MKTALVSITLIFSFLLPLICSASDTIVIAPGRFEDIPASHREKITVGSGAAVRVTDRGSVVRIVGKKLGSTQLRIGARTLEIQVVNESTYALYQRLVTVLSGKRGLRVDVEAKEIWVRGHLLRWSDWNDLADAASLSEKSGIKASYRFAAEMDQSLQTKAIRELQGSLRKASLPETAIVVQPAAVALVPITPPDLAKRVGEVLAPYGFRVDTSSSALSLEPLVRVRIIVAELKRERALQYGIKWPSAIHAQLLPRPSLAGDENLELSLEAFEHNGMGRILASPTLLCRSGKEAKFLAGGEFPIKIASRHSNDVIWKQYGVVLKIKPLADFSGRMSIALETEVSMLDANKVDGIPGVLTNRIESHFDLAHSRTIALSGLLKKEATESSDGLPGLSNIPILGPLFASKDFKENKTELVVFVTPDIARPDEENL